MSHMNYIDFKNSIVFILRLPSILVQVRLYLHGKSWHNTITGAVDELLHVSLRNSLHTFQRPQLLVGTLYNGMECFKL